MTDHQVVCRRWGPGTQAAALALTALLVLFVSWYSQSARADGNEDTLGAITLIEDDQGPRFVVPLYKSGAIRASKPISRISVGNPGIADIVVLRDNEVHVVGKALGATDIVLWDDSGSVFDSYAVEVIHDLETLKLKLHQLLPGEQIKVHSAQENIIVSGQVSNMARMQSALALAQSFLAECIKSSTLSATPSAQGLPPQINPLTGQPVQTGGSASAIQSLPGAGKGACDEGEVVNMMQVGGAQQVMLKVTVAEVARTVLKKFETDFNIFNLGQDIGIGAVQGGAAFPDVPDAAGLFTPINANAVGQNISPLGPFVDLFSPTDPGIDAGGVFLSYLEGDLFLQAVLDIQRRKGLAHILSEPTVTTLSGQDAEFLSGGEFPVPVPEDNGAIGIEFKEFGVGVKFLPVVMDSQRINLKLNISVTELSADNNVVIQGVGTNSAFVVPSLTKRSSINTVELANGQTIGIAGLINDSTREFIDKVPGLGDLPILGNLFRSQEFRSGQTELVIFVTPHLAKPINPNLVRLPTDSFVPPSDTEFYLWGKLESRDGPEVKPVASGNRGGPEGARFGHDL